jgi:hypothetical protein
MDKIKTGKEIVSNFVESLKDNAGLNQDITKAITNLHSQQKLTDTALANALEALRKEALK